MRIALINDTHAGARGDNPLFNEYFFRFWEGTFFPYLKEHNISQICHLGDVVDRRKFINFVTLNSWRQRFFDVLQRENIKLDVIVGNHDVCFKNRNDVNALHELFDHYDNINVMIEPKDVIYDGVSIAMMPWINVSNYSQSMDFIKNTKSEICFGHFEIAGFEMDKGNVCHEGLNRSTFEKFDIVLSGHFHHKSSEGNIQYLGNQYQITWSDYDDDKGFHVFDTETRELTFVSNPHEMFRKIYYDDLEQDFDFWKKFNFDKLKDCFVKVVVLNKNNPYLFDTVLDDIHKANAADVNIVEDFTELTSIEDDDIDQAEDTLTIVNKMIDGLTLNVESDKLKSIMRELYVESLNVEATE